MTDRKQRQQALIDKVTQEIKATQYIWPDYMQYLRMAPSPDRAMYLLGNAVA